MDEGMGYDKGDKLIVVGPRVENLDMYGACVMRQHGIDAFPFTIEAGIQLRIKELREITLESLFIDDDVLFIRGNARHDVISIKELQGKKIFLYIDKLCVVGDGYGGEDYERLASLYIEKKAIMEEDHSFEMVYVEVKRNNFPVLEDKERNKILSKMSWFVCPINGTKSANLDELLRLLNKDICYDKFVFEPATVGFGEDGQIYCVHEYFSTEYQLGDILYDDAERILRYDGFLDHRIQMFANPQNLI